MSFDDEDCNLTSRCSGPVHRVPLFARRCATWAQLPGPLNASVGPIIFTNGGW